MEARKLDLHERAHRTLVCDVVMDVALHPVCDVDVSGTTLNVASDETSEATMTSEA